MLIIIRYLGMLLTILSIDSCKNSRSDYNARDLSNIDTLTNIPITNEVNQYDLSGKKQGLWIDTIEGAEYNYFNGSKNGVYKSYYRNNKKLKSFGEYINDAPCGIWYYFDEQGRLYLKTEQVSNNNNIEVMNEIGEPILLPFKSTAYLYYNNGVMKSKGTALYEDIQLDFYMYDKWFFYDTVGELIRIDTFKEGKIVE